MISAKDKATDIRSTAIWALGILKDPSAVPCLIASMKDKNKEVRWRSAKALGEIKAADAVPVLQESLLYKEGAISRIIDGIKRMVLWLDLVFDVFDYSPTLNADIRIESAKALGEIGDAQAISALKESLQDRGKASLSDDRVCSVADEALKKLFIPGNNTSHHEIA